MLFPLLLSCKKEKVEPPKVPVQKIDSIATNEEEYHLDAPTIFGVYQLTDKDIAICLPVQFGNTDLPLSRKYEDFLEKDSLPWIYRHRGGMKDYKYYDTLFVDRLIYNKRFEDVFRMEMKDRYFVYGTKSSQECKVKRIVFRSTECGNDYIAYLLDVDKEQIGHPLIASEKKIPLNYAHDYSAVNPVIKKSASKESTENDYGNGNYNPKVFGNYKNLYFTYYDDFKWYDKSSDSDCQFPERAVFEIDPKGKVKMLWSSEMDLLGLPCL